MSITKAQARTQIACDIDQLIYQLYDLKLDEIAIVEGAAAVS